MIVSWKGQVLGGIKREYTYNMYVYIYVIYLTNKDGEKVVVLIN